MFKVTELERQQRREADREKSRAAVEALTSSEGWKAWLASRRHFHRYSLANQLLLAMQCPTATRVAGFRAWLKLGYCVRRGESALRIWVPSAPSKQQLEAWREAGADPREMAALMSDRDGRGRGAPEGRRVRGHRASWAGRPSLLMDGWCSRRRWRASRG